MHGIYNFLGQFVLDAKQADVEASLNKTTGIGLPRSTSASMARSGGSTTFNARLMVLTADGNTPTKPQRIAALG